jgi:tetraacyldisaccharide 4'-kinase
MTLLARPPRPRSPWQRLYGAAHARRRARAATRAERLPAAVVSVGNLHWGGAGKTPVVAALARQLTRDGRRVAILSRGYGRSGSGPLLVSRGAGPEVELERAGDEPHLLARLLPGVSVVVGARRIEAGRLALAALDPPPDLFLLDDGFSHVALARDLDLLVFPAREPLAGGRLWPSGGLREPLASAAAADAALWAGVESGGQELSWALAPHGFAGPIFASPVASGAPAGVDGDLLLPGARVVAACGIANPERFFESAAGAGLEVVARLPFPDHHRFPSASIERLERAVAESGAEALLVTEKERAKLEGRLRARLAVLPIEARPEPAFWLWLGRKLAEIEKRP